MDYKIKNSVPDNLKEQYEIQCLDGIEITQLDVEDLEIISESKIGGICEKCHNFFQGNLNDDTAIKEKSSESSCCSVEELLDRIKNLL